jgi:hypothetical protein
MSTGDHGHTHHLAPEPCRTAAHLAARPRLCRKIGYAPHEPSAPAGCSLAACTVTAALLRDRTDTQEPPPTRPGQPPPADPRMIPLTVPEITRLLAPVTPSTGR